MDITTVNDRHLYRGGSWSRTPRTRPVIELPRRVVRFGPAGRLTGMTDVTADADIELYPAGRLLAVTDLRGDGMPGHRSSGDG